MRLPWRMRFPGDERSTWARSCLARLCPTARACPAPQFELDPVKAAWDIGCMIRWLDFNDTWLAAEWGHPSDNLGGILAVADLRQPQATWPRAKRR